MIRTVFFIFLVGLCSCHTDTRQPKQSASNFLTDTVAMVVASDTLPDWSDNSRNSIAWKGTYVGELPSLKSIGVATTVTLSDDTFTWKQRQRGDATPWLTATGKFQWNAKGNQISLPVLADTFLFIVGENRLIFLDDSGLKVHRNATQTYELLKTNSPAANQYPITETKWFLKEIYAFIDTSFLPDRSYYLVLSASDNRFRAFMGCNILLGSYDISADNAIRFSSVSGKHTYCNDMKTEILFRELTSKITHYRLSSNSLLLYEKDKLLLKFTALLPK